MTGITDDRLRALTDWFTSQFGSTVRLEIAVPDSPGFSSETHIVEVTGSDTPTSRLVLRAEPERPAVSGVHDIEREFAMLKILDSAPVPTPAPRWLEPSGSVIGAPFLVMDFVDGDIIDDVDTEAHDVTDLQERYLALVDVIAGVHTAGLERTVGGDVVPTPPGLEAPIDAGADQRQRAGATEPLIDDLEDKLRSTLPEPQSAVLTHGDARLGNAIFQGSEVAALIDWEFAAISDPRRDLGYLEMMATFAGVLRPEIDIDTDQLAARWEHATGRRATSRPWFRALELYRTTCNLCVQRWLHETGQRNDPRVPELAGNIDLIAHGGLLELSQQA